MKKTIGGAQEIGSSKSDDWQSYQNLVIFQAQMHAPEGTVAG